MSNAYWKLGKRNRKAFVSVNNMEAWGLSQYESNIYTQAYNQARHMFAEAVKLFNGTYTYETLDKDAQGNTIVKYYPNLGITEEDLLNFYFEEYGDRLVARPFEPGRTGIISVGDPGSEHFEMRTLSANAAMAVCLDITYRKVQQFVKFNTYKYLTLVKTTGFVYNPIENYRMVEVEEINDEGEGSRTLEKDGTVGTEQLGSETYDRSIKASEISSIEITAPLSSLSGTMVDGVYSISDVGFSLNTEKTTTTALGESTGVEQGKTKGSTDASYNSQTKKAESSATTAAGTTPTSTSYSTTYDDTVTDRKTGKAETSGTVGTARTLSEVSAESINAVGSITTGNPSAYGYTDTIDFDDRSSLTTYDTLDTERTTKENTRERELTRSGNIGITTSQQMIESERELAAFNIIRQFCEDLNKEILLEVYDSGVPTEVLIDLFNAEN